MTVVEFIKNADLITILDFLIITASILAGFGLFLFARTKSRIRWFLLIGMVPLLSGILAMYLKYRYAGVAMLGPWSAAAAVADRHEGLIGFAAGVTGSIAVLLLGTIHQRSISRRHG
jgi:hypothetical protein